MGEIVRTAKNLLGDTTQNANFSATGVPIDKAVTVGQANTAYDATQSGLQQQQAFANQLAAQNGVGNQSQVFNQQQALAQALQAQVNGQGPNPAQAALNQSTGQNVANQAALMAGQRGTGANAGLESRQIAQQGAGIQQAAVGQGATMQAQQQLAAQQQLQQQQSNLANLATTQVGQQAGAIQGYNSAAQGEQGLLLGGLNAQNNASVGMQSNVNNANEGIAATNATNSAKTVGGIINSASGAGGKAATGGLAKGGMVIPEHLKDVHESYHAVNYRQGGTVEAPTPQQKATVPGNSYSNDKVDAKLSEDEIVIPREISMGDDPVNESAEFVKKELAKKLGEKGGKEHGDFKTALESAIKNRKSK